MNRLLGGLALLILLLFSLSSCASYEAEMLYKEAVKKEYQDGMESALPLYEKIIKNYSESDSATKAREKVLAYKKKKEEEIKLDEKIASFQLTKSQALRIVTNDCLYIRSKASFTLSTRCKLRILKVETVGAGKIKAAKIVIYGTGYWYDLIYTVSYALIFDKNGDFESKFLDVKKGRYSGLSILAQKVLKMSSDDPIKNLDDIISERDRGEVETSSSSYSSNRGSLRFQFDGQWFFGYIKSLKIKIEGRNTYYSYTESSSSDYVFFTGVPYDTYDFTIYAYEQSGQSGQAHSLKGNLSHKCKGTNVRISAGGGFIDPSVYVNCD